MKKTKLIALLLVIAVIVIPAGYFVKNRLSSSNKEPQGGPNHELLPIIEDEANKESQQDGLIDNEDDFELQIDVHSVKPDESGKIMVAMFHNFVDTFTPKSYDKGEYTTTFNEFRELLQTLYDKNYRLISMKDYLDNNISVPAGCTPMVFTFDDGTEGQFNLVERDGELVANINSAVGIMEEFYKSHPDFGLAGVFYVNLGNSTFAGGGTMADRLKYLTDKGFEIGNHTYTHADLLVYAKSEEDICMHIGENQQKLQSYLPGYLMETFSLPNGSYPSKYKQTILRGNYEGVNYENRAIFLVGANPASPTVADSFDPFNVPRVRAKGIEPINYDLAWWLDYFENYPTQKYVSDGNNNTVTVPEKNKHKIIESKLNGKKLVAY